MPLGLINHEAVFAALFAMVSGANTPAWNDGNAETFQVVSRVHRLPTELDVNTQMPALFMDEVTEEVQQKTPGGWSQLVAWDLAADLAIYIPAPQSQEVIGQETYIPGRSLNMAIDAVCKALAPAPGFPKQTLGGLVQHAQVIGRIDRVNGVPAVGGSCSIAVVPVRILTI